MFKNLTIRRKLTLLTVVAIVLFASFAIGAYVLDRSFSGGFESAVSTGKKSSSLIADARSAHVDFQRQVQEWKNVLIRGNDAALYQKHYKAFREKAEKVQEGLTSTEGSMHEIGMSTDLVLQLKQDHAQMLQKYLDALATFDASDSESGKKVDVLVRGVDRATSSNFDKLIADIVTHTTQTLSNEESGSTKIIQYSRAGILLFIVLGLMLFLGAFAIIRRVNTEIQGLRSVVEKINAGDFAARATASENSNDELDQLGNAFNNLLDQRLSLLAKAERENDQLNESISTIMMSVAELANRNLKVKIPVSQDVTGAVSDAINMMAHSTATALKQVNTISMQVSDSSSRARERANTVQKLADESGSQANAASSELTQTAEALNQIGLQARDAGMQAERALGATGEAITVVRATIDAIGQSRQQIQDTETRMKRLSELSSQITTTAGLIEEIAERTSVIALTASIQAVAAGDAGRGFAVVADEVKRLAESAHGATRQIGNLVGMIKTETTDTMRALNDTVSQVLDVSQLASRAGHQMDDTRAATQTLVDTVRLISESTRTQGEASQRLLARAQQLISASKRTLEEIELQRNDTEQLADSATSLVNTVSEFRLPA